MTDHSLPLATLLGLEERARTALDQPELAFVMVNETRQLLVYRQAALYIPASGVVAVSGVSTVERDAPFTLWLERLFRQLSAKVATEGHLLVSSHDLKPEDGDEWGEWLPEYGLWLPLMDPKGTPIGSLLYAREQPWSASEILLLQRALAIYGLAWAWRMRPKALALWVAKLRHWPRSRWLLTGLIAGALAFPVRLSVLAPATVAAHNPAIVRAPLEGVVERIAVLPNQQVEHNQLLLTLDTISLTGKLEVARQALATAHAEFEQATQQSFSDLHAKSQLAVIKSRIAEQQAKVAQLEDLLARCQVLSPRAGVVVIDDVNEWNGRPVAVGEKVMAIADPREVEVEAWLAPADMITLAPASPVILFLNTDPLNPLAATLDYIAYEATVQPDGTLAHKVHATLHPTPNSPIPRLGLKGTARLDGERVTLLYWLLRRPLATTRQFFGL